MIIRIIKSLFGKILKLFLLVVGTFRRALCCWRSRKSSDDSEVLPFRIDKSSLPTMNLDPTVCLADNEAELQSWQDWGHTSSNSVGDMMAESNYSKSKFQQKPMIEQEEAELDVNYFEDMIPDIKRQKKVLLTNSHTMNDAGGYHANNNRLSFDMRAPSVQALGSDLTTWDDSGDTNTTWEETMDYEVNLDANEVIREKRRQERQKRMAEQQRRKIEKEKQKKSGPIATKVR